MGDLDLVQSEECLGRLDLRKILEVTLRGVVYKLKASCRLVLGRSMFCADILFTSLNSLINIQYTYYLSTNHYPF